MPGDRIIKIDGVPTDGISLNEASRRLRGEKGTTVRLEVIHSGETEPVEIIIKRDVIQIKSVRGVRMLDPIYAIGYLQITRFQENTPQEFKKSVDRLRSVGLNGLIIDLRNNPGGALESAVSIAEMFLNNRTIVRIKERNKPMQEIKSGSNAVFSNIPVAVLTNRGTASAAEVLAGALQDNEVAILVGERTFGKGSVQSLYALSSEPSILKLTTALYFTPNYHSVHKGVPCLHNGICYHRQTDLDAASGGLRPNLEVPLSQNEQLLLRKLQQQSEFEGEKYDPTVALAVDRQLRSALDVLRNRSLFKKTLSYTTEEF
jgi:carboxyl-terminal processing protease